MTPPGAALHATSPQTNTVTTDSNIAHLAHTGNCTDALSWKGWLLGLLVMRGRGRTAPFGRKVKLLVEYQFASLLVNLPVIQCLSYINTCGKKLLSRASTVHILKDTVVELWVVFRFSILLWSVMIRRK